MPTTETIFSSSSTASPKLHLNLPDDLTSAWAASDIEKIVPGLIRRLPKAINSPARDFYCAGMHSVIQLILTAQVAAAEPLSEAALKDYLTEPRRLIVLKDTLPTSSPVKLELERFLESFTWRIPKGYFFDSFRYSETIGPMVMLLSLSIRNPSGDPSRELFVV